MPYVIFWLYSKNQIDYFGDLNVFIGANECGI